MNLFRQGRLSLKIWLDKRASLVNREAVIKDIILEVDISGGYFLVLTLANLIALCGLITNSVPVIIGAMLISPLMGPILSFGFAFITGLDVIWKKSIKKIIFSILITIIAAAAATYISPLKDLTGEIISRTRPDLYDLLIAFISGIAGAIAICTKKNYLTIVPGVAIATAVIPPLSVAGFGIGIRDLQVFAGGFFLFFTNFVAIVIATCMVFFVYGFRPSIVTDAGVSRLRRRTAFLAAVLLFISIPLIYTLYQSIAEVQLRSEIQDALKQEFNIEQRSRLSTFNYLVEKGGLLEVHALINTVSYLTEDKISRAEKDLRSFLNKKVQLTVEQVLVQSGGISERAAIKGPLSPSIAAPPTTPPATVKTPGAGLMAGVRETVGKIKKIISPSVVTGFSVAFDNKTTQVSVALNIKRDSPLSDEQVLWLKRMFAEALALPVNLTVNTTPFVPDLVFKAGATSLSDGMKKQLLSIRGVYLAYNKIIVTIKSYPESSLSYRKRIRHAAKRAEAVRAFLTKDINVPVSQIRAVIDKKQAVKKPIVKVSIATQTER
ncbi:MAG: TIGR00341 family protein [Syntrophobacteraceae bacterium]